MYKIIKVKDYKEICKVFDEKITEGELAEEATYTYSKYVEKILNKMEIDGWDFVTMDTGMMIFWKNE